MIDKNKEAKYWGIGSLTASLFFPTLGVISGIVSLVKGRKNEDKSHTGFAIGGIVIGGVNLIVRFAFVVTVAFGLLTSLVAHSDLPVDKGPNHKNDGTYSSINPNCERSILQDDSEVNGLINEDVAYVACQVLGMDETSAVSYISENGYTSRIAERDGEGFPMTMDYRPERINLHIKGGRVFDTTLG